MMGADERYIIALWIGLAAYWVFMAAGVKRSVPARGRVVTRLTRVIAVVLLLLLLVNRHGVPTFEAAAGSRSAIGGIGVVICALGVAVAVRARTDLGRNWGVPMSRRVDPDLVTSGPYRFVRHPIYSGILLAMLGSALAVSLLWIVALALCGGYFLFSALREEVFMTERFPDQYPAYRRRTKMLIPFVL